MASLGLDSPRVSIVVPVWNRAPLIEQCLRSALTQSFEDFELIVVDDGSSDGSAERAEALADPRIRVLRQPHSGSPAAARNVGLRAARGKFVAFLDSDDQWLPDKLAQQVQLLDARPDAALAYGLASYFDGRRERGVCGPKVARISEWIFERLLLDGNFIQTSSVLMQRDVYEKVGGFDQDPRLRAVEDLDLWLRVASRYPVLFVPRVVTRYRMHEGNLSRDKREMVGKVRAVIAATCERFAVPEPLRARALARWHVEELKAELAHGDSETAAREAIARALAIDPGQRTARWAERALDLRLYPALRLAYRNRQPLLALRDGWHRLLRSRFLS